MFKKTVMKDQFSIHSFGINPALVVVVSRSPFGNGRKRFVRGDLQRNKTRRCRSRKELGAEIGLMLKRDLNNSPNREGLKIAMIRSGISNLSLYFFAFKCCVTHFLSYAWTDLSEPLSDF